ncbi:dihydropyrimidinase [Brenneria goodwinii]|uniref:dihydropyrimidinase n=1 Tax=Brenneria goodwinii TaxID=1109412 RepID=UPI0036E0F136
MMTFDMTIRNGKIVSNGKIIHGDIGIKDGVIQAIEASLPVGLNDIDAAGRWVLPGGIDSHCHIEQLSGMGVMGADDFYSATVSAAFGGTTTVIPFAAQHRGNSIPDVLKDYSKRASEKAVIDYGFHLILTDTGDENLSRHLPEAIDNGITSLKVYMTYDKLKLSDYDLLDVLQVANENGALVMVHAENNDIIKWLSDRLIKGGYVSPKYHGVAHDPLAESEATNRAITLGRIVDTPILIVHVAGAETVQAIRQAQARGVSVFAESCPQYLFLTADDLDREGMEGAKFCCSPPPRDASSQQEIWKGFQDGTLNVYSSDHAPYRYDESGKLPHGDKTTFKQIANGVPGLELRMPLLFSEGVMAGKIDIHKFVELTATSHARLYGLLPHKGKIEVGFDADIAIWNESRITKISYSSLHDKTGYTPYEDKVIKGWPEVVINRGRIIVQEGELHAARGSGHFIKRGRHDFSTTASASSGKFIHQLLKNGKAK